LCGGGSDCGARYISLMFDFYPACELHLARLQLVCFMLAMGTTLALRDFVAMMRRPRSFLWAVFVQLLVLPWLAVLIDLALRLPPGIAVGLVLVAAMPGGALSKLFSYIGRGNAALSISLTAFTTFASVATVPILLQLLVAHYIQVDFTMPAGDILVFDLGLCLLLPLFAGMGIGRFWPRRRDTVARWCVRIGLVVVAMMIAGSLGSGRIKPGEYGWTTPAAITLFCVVGQQVSMLPFYFCNWPRADRMAVGIEVTMRNMNLALLLKARLFPEADEVGNGVLFVVLFYAAAAMGAGLPLALNHRRLSRREAMLTNAADA
jgi:BASS family bile acid:Na+ symporter